MNRLITLINSLTVFDIRRFEARLVATIASVSVSENCQVTIDSVQETQLATFEHRVL